MSPDGWLAVVCCGPFLVAAGAFIALRVVSGRRL